MNQISILISKQIIKALIKKTYLGLRGLRIKILIKAFWDGIHNNDGKIIDPQAYNKDLIRIKEAKDGKN